LTTKAQAIKALKQILTFGNPQLTKSINAQEYTSKIKTVCEMLLARITSGLLQHEEYWVAVYGLQWCVSTGRATYVLHYLDSLDVQGILNLIEDIKRSCQSLSDVEIYINKTLYHHITKAM